MTTLDTSRSDNMAKKFLAKKRPFKRKVQVYKREFGHSVAAVFEQLCPTREADWIDGWEADLIYASDGYVEKDCVFTTPKSNFLLAGTWAFTRYEANELVELLILHDGGNIVEHCRIRLIDNGNGTCEGIWTLTFTALTKKGNQIIEKMPDKDPDFDIVLGGLDSFLETGERIKMK